MLLALFCTGTMLLVVEYLDGICDVKCECLTHVNLENQTHLP